MLMAATALQGIQRSGCADLRFYGFAHPDQILDPAFAPLWLGGFARGAAPARRKGSLTLAQTGLPNLPRLRLVQMG